MTSVLNLASSSSSNINAGLRSNILPPLASGVRYPTTFIIQPPSSNQSKPSINYKPAELGDLLMKKIKTQSQGSSSGNSCEQSPVHQANFNIDEEAQSSVSGSSESADTQNQTLFPQRSLSTPLFYNQMSSKPLKMQIEESQNQVQQALEILRAKLLSENKALLGQDILSKNLLKNEIFGIPPLTSSLSACELKAEKPKTNDAKKGPKKNFDKLDVIYGSVEFPFLEISTPYTEFNNLKQSFLDSNLFELQKDNLSSKSSTDFLAAGEKVKLDEKAKGSLTVTRAQTQQTDLLSDEDEKSYTSKKESNKGMNKKRINVKNTRQADTKKSQKKSKKAEKDSASKLDSDEEPSYFLKGKRLTNRRKNKWQLEQEEKLSQVTDKKVSEENDQGKLVKTPIGPSYQASIPELTPSNKSVQRRSPQIKSNPMP